MTQKFKNYIDGRFSVAQTSQWLDVFEPATAKVYGHCTASGSEEANAAVGAAQAALPAWQKLRHSERARWLHKLADAIEQRIEEFAAVESKDTGKPLTLTRTIEIPRAIRNLRFFAACAETFASESHHGEAGLNYTLRNPMGIVAAISPWNLPLYLLTWKIAPALATGNCVIAKPSEITPATADLLAQCAQAIGLPNGVLNIVHGRGEEIGKALVEHPSIKAITFTGSTTVGRNIAISAAQQLKKVSLELGGKNASVVFADAPRENLIDTLLRSAFQNSGQICLCGSRLLIHESIYAELRDQLVTACQQLKLGPPEDHNSAIGAMVSEAHYQKVMSYIELAKQEGGTLLCGGNNNPQLGGWYIEPTIFENLGPTARCNREEIFGPVLTLQSFSTEQQAIELANATEYGLSASIWTQDLSRAHNVATRLQVGMVWVNTWLVRDLRTPFGGVKQSGLGREGGWEAMRFFTETKNICIATE